VAAVWSGPSIEGIAWRNDKAVAGLVAKSAARRTTLEDAERVIEDLIRVGILRRDDAIVATCVYDIKYGYCIYNRERKPAVRKIKTWLLEHEITTAGRYGLWAYFWSHESILNGLNTGRAVRKRVTGHRHSTRGAQEPG
jgi:protoporphyrinogen oxidase